MKLNSMMRTMVTVVIMFCTPIAQAALIEKNGFFTDTTNKLDWLWTTQTRGKSIDTISAMLLPGGALAGWQYATQQQLADLGTEAFGVVMLPTKNTVQKGDTIPLQDLFKVTQPSALGKITHLFTKLENNFNTATLLYNQSRVEDLFNPQNSLQTTNLNSAVIGSALVRGTTVPCTITLSNTDFSTSDNIFLAAIQIQVDNSVNVFANAGLTLEAPKTFITAGFHAHSGSSVHITAKNVGPGCSIPINANLRENSL